MPYAQVGATGIEEKEEEEEEEEGDMMVMTSLLSHQTSFVNTVT
jgi:hypothetical protein